MYVCVALCVPLVQRNKRNTPQRQCLLYIFYHFVNMQNEHITRMNLSNLTKISHILQNAHHEKKKGRPSAWNSHMNYIQPIREFVLDIIFIRTS